MGFEREGQNWEERLRELLEKSGTAAPDMAAVEKVLHGISASLDSQLAAAQASLQGMAEKHKVVPRPEPPLPPRPAPPNDPQAIMDGLDAELVKATAAMNEVLVQKGIKPEDVWKRIAAEAAPAAKKGDVPSPSAVLDALSKEEADAVKNLGTLLQQSGLDPEKLLDGAKRWAERFKGNPLADA